MRSPLQRWLTFRMRLICVTVFVLASLLPPYVPRSAQAQENMPASSQQFLFVEDGFLMKQSSLGQQGSRLAYGEGIIHKVKAGETLQNIAKRYNLKPETIQWANGIQPGVAIQPDQELVVLPVDGVLHTVRRGQTLGRIAQLYDVALEEIQRQNKLRGSMILAGQQLIIPAAKPRPGAVAEVLRFGDNVDASDVQVRVASGGGGKPAQAVGPAVGAVLTQTVLQMPCGNCIITQYFNARHFAVDVQTRGGGPIYAAEAGTVIRADKGWNGGYGNVVEIDHGNGLVTLYGHNKELYVKEGDTIERGQRIAWMGNSGLVYGPTGIHIHFEVRVNGVKKNPMLYLE
ncbi:MAG: peptidoglycan DD-metalloendopeptidase family protein [Patescibacteria group bacterium]